ncbi:Glycosyltransferase, catalytic subunit of cellulose synthase and poly-beta-1,6-N-acetylglucosamine synthase [Paenibacillus sp. UNCCL117]|uniref:glycosyltransferase family 2 protein n=1 Tax=unclassified Paenibacillus TaxID=185978 RepID=UPI00088B1B81|nr:MULTISPECIES: glycosyltransferase family 2 protein [unclassified Paenibacillus]SDE37211.1 Glycosyltransferase, catalytic subunit of cellulose synthase and poly-beta-1,6-N-acetylglucosamine synthase [Paenibacillus sp. cl123]SFW64900.1 Glycosyltransferase, catalytic subunit of cellulose synthase and poly-beta-1,6-N-acetylglucosamine synthase [Paenibacillus sp. UNCCL117]
MSLLGFLSLFALGYWIFMLVDTLRAQRLMFTLPHDEGNTVIQTAVRRQAAAADRTQGLAGKQALFDYPLVSIIIAAKEEESTIADTVKHLLGQTYPRIEIIAVNDRSQDGTGHKLDELRSWSEKREGIRVPLRIIHITSLPAGWIGKNHALYQGYTQARGKYLLFTDADVRFSPEAVSDAVAYLQQERADHLTLAPRMRTSGFWLKAFVHYFFFTLSLYVRPWRSNDDLQHRHGMGIGAFNLMTRRAYEAIGTHREFAMRPDDDLELGRRVKRRRLRQRLASGADHIEVEWYRDLNEAVKGLEKNLFSGFGYKVSIAALGILGQLLLFFLPLVAWAWAPGWAAWCFGASAVLMLIVYLKLIRSITGGGGRELIGLPVTILLLVYVVGRSVGLTLRQGGIYWRGTFYSLKELRSMRDE